MAEIIIVTFLIFCHLVACIDLVNSKIYTGDLEGFPVKLDSNTLIVIFLVITIGYILLIYFYRRTRIKKIRLFEGFNLDINRKRFSILFFLVILSQLIFFLQTGVGKVGGDATSPYSFIFAMFNVNSIFGLFYFLCRKNTNKILYILNIALYCILLLLKGWSSFLLLIFFFEVYFYFQRRPVISFANYIKVLILPIFAILIGGKIYQYVHAYKNLVRFNAEIENTYSEGVTLLLSRLSFYPVSVGAYQNSEKLENLYYKNYVPLRDIQSMFRPISPGFLMPNKEFRIIGNLVVQSFHPEVSSSTSSNFGLISYLHTLFKINILEFIIFIIIGLFLIILVKGIFDSLESYSGELDFLYFILLLNFFEVATLEMVFGYGILPIIFFIPIFILFRVVRIQKNSINTY